MASKEDMKLFFSETEDLLQNIEDSILEFEENSKNNKPIQDLFFSFHTLKGITAMIGLNNLSQLCHSFETFLEKNKDIKDVKLKKDVIPILFECLDIIRNTINNLKGGQFKDLDSQILEELTKSFDEGEEEGGSESTFIKEITIDEIKNAVNKDKENLYKIYVRIQDTCVFKKVRLFIIFRALNNIGKICASKPDPKQLEKGCFESDFEIFFITKNSSPEITNILGEILEIENKVVTKTTLEDFLKEVEPLYKKTRLRSAQENLTQSEETEEKFEEESIEEIGTEEESDNIPLIHKETTNVSVDTLSVKVNIEVLEKLMNYFGEAVILKNQLNQIFKQRQDWSMNRLFDNMDKLFLEIQEIIFKLKLVRVESTFRKYKRLVRDIAKDTNKEVNFVLEGLSVEIDRKILEELNSPIVHILRNGISHGIESPRDREIKGKNRTGTLKLSSIRQAGSIYIEIEDDGKGIDYEAIKQKGIEKGLLKAEDSNNLSENDLNKLLLLPGFSTLSDADIISGRGMGLAIVSEKLKELSGSLQIESVKDQGTKFILSVPFTRAILKAQLLKVGGDLFAIPCENIKQIFFINKSLIEYVKGEEYYRMGSKMIPILRLNKYLEFINVIPSGEKKSVITNSDSRIGIWCLKDEDNSSLIIVDELLQQMEVVIKPFKSKFSKFQEILGVAITGDGSICLVIDVLNIITSLTKQSKNLQLVQIPQ